MTAIDGKLSAFNASTPLTVSTLTASTVALGGNNAPLLKLYSTGTGGSSIDFGQSNTTRTFHIQQTGSNLQFWRSLYTTKSFEISNVGYVTFFAGYGASSDYRLKTPNPPAASTEDAIAMLKAVQARTYHRFDLPDTEANLSRIGFVAQEVEAGCPSNGSWGNLISTAQYSLRPGQPETEIKCLDYARLTCVLWQCTRSLLARVEALEAKVP